MDAGAAQSRPARNVQSKRRLPLARAPGNDHKAAGFELHKPIKSREARLDHLRRARVFVGGHASHGGLFGRHLFDHARGPKRHKAVFDFVEELAKVRGGIVGALVGQVKIL